MDGVALRRRRERGQARDHRHFFWREGRARRRHLAPAGRPTRFDRLGLLIPGRRIGRADIEAIAGRRSHHLRVAILAGQYDRANVATARSVRQALADAGHAVDYTEVPEGHSAVTWTNHLRVVLTSLFGDAR